MASVPRLQPASVNISMLSVPRLCPSLVLALAWPVFPDYGLLALALAWPGFPDCVPPSFSISMVSVPTLHLDLFGVVGRGNGLAGGSGGVDGGGGWGAVVGGLCCGLIAVTTAVGV